LLKSKDVEKQQQSPVVLIVLLLNGKHTPPLPTTNTNNRREMRNKYDLLQSGVKLKTYFKKIRVKNGTVEEKLQKKPSKARKIYKEGEVVVSICEGGRALSCQRRILARTLPKRQRLT
jgi:hypothetical protein